MSGSFQLLVGLGNPGSKYSDTRHNAGAWLVERVVERFGEPLRAMPRCLGAAGEARIGAQRVRVFRPDTFMNESGRAVAAAARFFKIAPEAILVAHDELDLAPGIVRLKKGGGHGGHNGLRDVIPQLGSAAFSRIRIGVGHPGHRDAVIGYVLKRPPTAEQRLIEDAIERVVEQLPRIVAGEVERAMNELHRRDAASEDV